MRIPTYLLKQMVGGIIVVVFVVILTFFLIHLAPGDPAVYLAGELGTPEYVELIRKELGLEKPITEQFIIYFSRVMLGDLGYSVYYNMPVLELIFESIPLTLLLIGTSLLLSTTVGIIIGVAGSKNPNSLADYSTSILAVIGYSVPVYWVGSILLLVFSLQLGLFPAQGAFGMRVETDLFGRIIDLLHHLVLPVMALSTINLALVTRLLKSSMSEVLEQKFITTARVKGLGDNRIYYTHALKNAILPVVTVVGMNIGRIFAGALLVETIFAWPGLGRLLYEALTTRDYPVVTGLFIVISIMVVVANFITDIVYALVDPRIRYK